MSQNALYTIIKDLKSTVGLTEKDWKEYEVKTSPTGGVIWNAEKDKGVEIAIGDKGNRKITFIAN